MKIQCVYRSECTSAKDRDKCSQCVHNTMRNFAEDYFKKADDKAIPNMCPRIAYNGTAEQTLGYKCPVCGAYTNPYHMRDKLCSGCGYELNIG